MPWPATHTIRSSAVDDERHAVAVGRAAPCGPRRSPAASSGPRARAAGTGRPAAGCGRQRSRDRGRVDHRRSHRPASADRSSRPAAKLDETARPSGTKTSPGIDNDRAKRVRPGGRHCSADRPSRGGQAHASPPTISAVAPGNDTGPCRSPDAMASRRSAWLKPTTARPRPKRARASARHPTRNRRFARGEPPGIDDQAPAPGGRQHHVRDDLAGPRIQEGGIVGRDRGLPRQHRNDRRREPAAQERQQLVPDAVAQEAACPGSTRPPGTTSPRAVEPRRRSSSCDCSRGPHDRPAPRRASPARPRGPAPRISASRTVSAWSSRVCPTARCDAPHRAAASLEEGVAQPAAGVLERRYGCGAPRPRRRPPRPRRAAPSRAAKPPQNALVRAGVWPRSRWLKCATPASANRAPAPARAEGGASAVESAPPDSGDEDARAGGSRPCRRIVR